MSKKNTIQHNTENKEKRNPRPALKVTVIPAEGRFSFEMNKKMTSQKVFDMGFSAASIISSLAGASYPDDDGMTSEYDDDDDMVAEFGFTFMTSMLSSFSTIMEMQGEKEAIDYACRLMGRDASSLKPFSISFFRQQGLEYMNVMYGIAYDNKNEKSDSLVSFAVFAMLCVAKMAMKFIPHNASNPNEGVLMATDMGVQYISNIYDAQDEFIDDICDQYESIIDGYESGDGYYDDDDDYDDDYDNEDITDDDMPDIDRFIGNGNGLVS